MVMIQQLDATTEIVLPDGQLTVYYDTASEKYLYRRICRMKYGDAVKCYSHGGWRLEYICPDQGFVRYALYAGERLVGIQYVRAANWLTVVQHYLSAYLTVLGFTFDNTELLIGDARTPVNAETNRLPKLFVIPDEELFGDANAEDEDDF